MLEVIFDLILVKVGLPAAPPGELSPAAAFSEHFTALLSVSKLSKHLPFNLLDLSTLRLRLDDQRCNLAIGPGRKGGLWRSKQFYSVRSYRP